MSGLVFLSEEVLHLLCREPMTLGQFLAYGGKALFNHKFDHSLFLEPFLQIKLLSRILLDS
jgi:hypothetical protein